MRTVGTVGSPAPISEILEHLEADGLLAYPTETVYGVGARADEKGVAAVRALKGRMAASPFLLLLPTGVNGPFDPERWGLRSSEEGEALARAFWPGPLTMVLSDPEAHFPLGIRAPSGGVAVRVSSHPFVEALMARWDRPLISTSANRSGAAPAREAGDLVRELAGAPGAERLWIVGGAALPPGLPSTLVDLTSMPPRVIRPGAVSVEALRRVVPELDDGGV